MKLRLQLFHSGKWQNASSLAIPASEQGRHGSSIAGYAPTTYAIGWLGIAQQLAGLRHRLEARGVTMRLLTMPSLQLE